MPDVIRLWMRAAVEGCSLLPNFLKIKAKHAWENALHTAKLKPKEDKFVALLIKLIGSNIK